MSKKKFYIYQEDLIVFSFEKELVSISAMVIELNDKFCQDDMKKLRTEAITDFLLEKKVLKCDKKGIRRPTMKGRLLGIEVEEENRYMVNKYNITAQQYVLDCLPFIF